MQEELADENQAEPIDEELPEFGEIDGQKVKLAGLDYQLLKEEKAREAIEKRGFLANLQTKLNIVSGNVLDRVLKEQREQQVLRADPGLKTIKSVLEPARAQAKEEKVDIYYQFDLDEFGGRGPKVVQRRLGKMSKKPLYLHFDGAFFDGLSRSLAAKKSALMHIQEVEAKQDVEDDDDIFGDQGSEQEKLDIKIGKKLEFGIDEDIFAQKRMQPGGEAPQESTEEDKYFFMRREPKKMTGVEEDGYGECYHQSGPSLKELVEMKKQGIEYFGEAREFKAKERKGPNIHQEYNKIQKIIEKKNKK